MIRLRSFFLVVIVVRSFRLMQDTQPYAQLSAFVNTVTLLDLSTLDNITRQNYLNSTDKSINTALQAAQQYLKGEDIQTSMKQFNDSHLTVTTVKANKANFTQFLQKPTPPLVGNASPPMDPYPNDTVFSITELIFKQNPYKATANFPYPNSLFEVALLYIQNNNNVSTLPSAIPYLFFSGLMYTGLVNDTASLAKFLYQTRLVTCIIRNESNVWVRDGVTRSTLVHPQGKVLIQCNSNVSNLPVTIVNDTNFLFNKNPNATTPLSQTTSHSISPGDQPKGFTSATILWVVIGITFLWGIFIVTGYKRDMKTNERQKALGLDNILEAEENEDQSLNGQLYPGKVDSENHNFQRLQKDEKQHSFVVQFDGKEINVTKKKKKQECKKKADLILFSQFSSADAMNTLQNQSLIDQTQRNLAQLSKIPLSQTSSLSRIQLNQTSQNQSKFAKAQSDKTQSIKAQSIKEQSVKDDKSTISDKRQSQTPETPQVVCYSKDEDDNISDYEDNNEESDDSYERIRKQDRKDKEDLQYQGLNTGIKLDHEKVDRVVRKQVRSLPPMSLKTFIKIFLRVHELYSNFYQFNRDHSRAMRFLISYCKTILVLALSGYFAPGLSLHFNCVVMLAGLAVANVISHIAAIVMRHKGKMYGLLGVIILIFEMLIAGYICFNTFIKLTPKSHDVWLYTFCIITFFEMFIVEFILTGIKASVQPCMEDFREKDDQISQMIYVTFYDLKIQNIWKRSFKQENDLLQQQGEEPSPIILSPKVN